MYYIAHDLTLHLDPQRCRQCLHCLDVCPRGVLGLDARRRVSLTDRSACIECGACQKNCPHGAITVRASVGCAAAILASRRAGRDEVVCDASCCASAATSYPTSAPPISTSDGE